MADIKNKKCEHPDCGKSPSYSSGGTKRARFCVAHKDPGMVNVVSKRCEHLNCDKQPTYAPRGAKRARFCAAHKDPHMVNVKDKRCEHLDCEKIPAYAPVGAKRARFCAVHKEPDMVDIVNKRCEVPNCCKKPTYAYRGANRALFCMTHKKLSMVNVMHKRCEHLGCDKIPVYAPVGAKMGQFCVAHKDPGMVNVVCKRCEQLDCDKQSSYAPRGAKRARFCVAHKDPGMVNVKDKRCEHLDCDKRPTYAPRGAKRARFCVEHKEPYMVNVKDKRCQFLDCDNRAYYGFPGLDAKLCGAHKEQNGVGMVREPKRLCHIQGCRIPAIWGALRHDRCDDHKIGDDTNFVELPCTSCGLAFLLDAATGRCDYCRLGPRCRLARQREVRNYLEANMPEKPWTTYDAVPEDITACNDRYRPDFMWAMDSYVVVLEVDEEQHRTYAEFCDCARMINLLYSFGRPTFFLRFNPDGYVPCEGRSSALPSEWGLKRRLKTLQEWLTNLLDSQPEGIGGVLRLFFDGFAGPDLLCWEPLLIA